jgi:anaphase-promoting complex subunit 3
VQTAPNISLCEWMHAICSATYGLEIFDTSSVVEILSRLPPAHYESPMVQGMIGNAFMEGGKFVEAESAFSSSLKSSPSGIVDFIDRYSSILWQLKKEVELAHLCTHGLRISNRQRCYKLWIAIANSFSLQRDHESAIKCLNRSIQINSNYAYSHVLAGQEFFSLEKFDKAKQCYQRAIEIDPRSYNAYWGLGQTFLKQEEFNNAKYNFVKSLEINPKSSTVRYSLALVALALKENDLAYQQLSIAIELNPKNAPALCQKGILELTIFGKTDLAKDTLEKALAIVPNEPVVHVLLGRIYATNPSLREDAMMCFNTALELMKGSKDHLGVKQCIEEIDVIGSV